MFHCHMDAEVNGQARARCFTVTWMQRLVVGLGLGVHCHMDADVSGRARARCSLSHGCRG